MKSLNLDGVREYVNENIVDFHQRKIKSLEELRLEKLLTKNPYLFKAKNISTASELITDLLEAFLSSSEEKLFGDFLEGLAVFVAQKTCGGHKSTAPEWIWSSSTKTFTMLSRSSQGQTGATVPSRTNSNRI